LTPTSSATGRVEAIRDGNSTALGGDFTVSFRGQVTGYIPFDVSADEMKSTLES